MDGPGYQKTWDNSAKDALFLLVYHTRVGVRVGQGEFQNDRTRSRHAHERNGAEFTFPPQLCDVLTSTLQHVEELQLFELLT